MRSIKRKMGVAVVFVAALTLCTALCAFAGPPKVTTQAKATHVSCGSIDGTRVSAFNLNCVRVRKLWHAFSARGATPRGWSGANIDVHGGLAILYPSDRSRRVIKAVNATPIDRRVLGEVPLVVGRVPYENHRVQLRGRSTSFWTGWDYESKASHFAWGGAGVHGTASSVNWHGWGSRKAVGGGKGRVCFSTGGGCKKVAGFKVVASKRRGYMGGESRQYMYCKTEISGRISGDRFHSVFHPPATFC